MRKFQTPSGGQWTANVCRITHCSFGTGSSIAVSGSVLRFSSADGVIFDLEDYPGNWEKLNDKGLLELLRIATVTTPAWPAEVPAYLI